MDVAAPDPGPPPVKREKSASRRLLGGAAWVASGEVITQLIALATTIVVARQLGPGPYGVAALANLILGFAGLFRDLGFAPAIATGRLAAPEELDSAHWMLVVAGGAWALLAIALSPLLAAIFDSHSVQPVLHVASLSLFVLAWGLVPKALLQRQGKFSALAGLSISQQLLTSVLAVTLALLGHGVWALVLPNIVASGVNAGLAWHLARVRPKLRFRASLLRRHAREGANITGFTVFNYLTRNADNAIIGRQFGEQALGQYAFAYALMRRPVTVVSQALSGPLLPKLAELRNDLESCDRAVIRVVGTVLRVVSPILVLGAVLSHLMVPLLFGARWPEAAPLVRVLLLLGAVQVVGPLFGTLWLGFGQTTLLFRWGLFTGLGSIGVYWLGALLGGPLGVAMAYAVYSGLMLWATVVLTRRFCKLALAAFAPTVGRILVDLSLMAALALAVERGLLWAGASAWLRLILAAALGLLAYVSILRLVRRQELASLIGLLPWPLAKRLRSLLKLAT
jgi:O-antigen/teichoic acid export membrane protein